MASKLTLFLFAARSILDRYRGTFVLPREAGFHVCRKVFSWAFLRISPASRGLPVVQGLFKGLPPTLIQLGEGEMMLDQMRTLKDRMKADMGDDMVKYVEVKDGTHILLALPWHEEEKKAVYQEVREWARSVF